MNDHDILVQDFVMGIQSDFLELVTKTGIKEVTAYVGGHKLRVVYDPGLPKDVAETFAVHLDEARKFLDNEKAVPPTPDPDPDLPCPHPERKGRHKWHFFRDANGQDFGPWQGVCRACGAVRGGKG